VLGCCLAVNLDNEKEAMTIDTTKQTLRDLGISEAWMPQVLGRLVEVAESSTVDGFNGLLGWSEDQFGEPLYSLAATTRPARSSGISPAPFCVALRNCGDRGIAQAASAKDISYLQDLGDSASSFE